MFEHLRRRSSTSPNLLDIVSEVRTRWRFKLVLRGAVCVAGIAFVLFLIAAYLAWIGTRLLRRAAAGLMDEQDVEDDRVLRALLDSHIGHDDDATKPPHICSYH